MKTIKILILYFVYSISIGGFLQRELTDAFGENAYAIVAGPSIALGRMHGIEFYIFATLIFLPIFHLGTKKFAFHVNILLALLFLVLWVAFGAFLK